MDYENVPDIEEKTTTTGGWIGVIILSLLTGFGFTMFTGTWTTDTQFLVAFLLASVVALLIFAVAYSASVDSQNKTQREKRIEEASTQYLRDNK